MATFNEIFAGYESPNKRRNVNNRFFNDVFAGYEPPEAEQPEVEEPGISNIVGNVASGLGLVAATAVNTAGDALKKIGEMHSDTFGRDTFAGRVLNAAGDALRSDAGHVIESAGKSVTPLNNDTFSGALSNSFLGHFLGSVGSGGYMLHSDDAAEKLLQVAQALQNDNPVPAELSWEYFSNPRGFTSDAGQLLGSMAAIMPFMLLGPEAAFERGVAKFGGDALINFLINRGWNGAAKVFAGGAPNTFRYALTSAPAEALMEGGSLRRDLLNQGYSDDEATRRSLIAAATNLPLLVGSNLAEGAFLFSPLLRAPRHSKLANFVQILGRGGLNSLQEQYEEAMQQGIQNWQMGRPFGVLPRNWTDDQWEAASHVRYPAALMGAGGGVAQALRGRDDNTENWRRGNEEDRNLRTWTNQISDGQMSDGVFNSIVRIAREMGYTPAETQLALAVATAESGGDQRAFSPVGAIGVMQLMPETAQSLGVDPHDQEQNIRGGLMYLRQQLDSFGGDFNLAAAAYNAGPNAVKLFNGIPPYGETQKYVRRINDDLGKLSNFGGGRTDSGRRNERTGGGNIFGVENYDMPVAEMESSVDGLKSGWREVIPQIGGVLKSMGFDPVLTSAARTREHQMRINPDAPNSYHIIQDDGGDAIDISLSEGELTPEQEQKVLNYFKGTGLFSEVLYHAVVGGKHLHLGGLNTENLRQGNVQNPAQGNRRTSPQQNSYDPNFNDRQNQVWQIAQYASRRAKEKYGYDIPPELIYKQWVQEAGVNFDSPNARYNNNLGGLTQVEFNGEENKQPDGGNYYRTFGSFQEYADAFIDDFIKYYPEINGVKTEREYASVLKKYGYFGSPLEDYIAGMESAQAPQSGFGGDVSGGTNNQNAPQNVSQNAPPIREVTADDSLTDKLFERFARERMYASEGEQAAEDYDFFSGMFTDKDKFRNTPENRQAILDRYGDEFNVWRQALQQDEQPAQTQSQTQPKAQPQPSDQLLNNQPVIEAAKKFLTQLRDEGKNPQAVIKLQNAIASGNIAEIQNILRENGAATTQSQTQSSQDPVQNNQPPENVLSQPQTQPTQENQPTQIHANEFVQTALAKPVGGNDKAAKAARVEQGKNLITLANQHGVDISDFKTSLERGTIKAVAEAQNRLLNSGKLFNSEPQQKQTPSQEFNFAADLNSVHQEIPQEKSKRTEQGAAILRVVNFSQAINSPQFQQQHGKIPFPKIDLPEGLAVALQNGSEKAIRKAQEIFANAGLKIESAPQETETQGNGLRGNTAEVITGSRTAHQIRYRVVEASELNSSHAIGNGGIFRNENYPSELQPRDRQRADMQAQLISMGNNLNPADLLDARDVNQGAPTTRSDGVVLNGNGRVAAIRYAYENGKGNAYKNALIENAERFGLSGQEISKMNQPVLIRELTHGLSEEETRDLTGTQTGGARLGASEQAQADAAKLSAETLAMFPQSDNVDLTHAESTDFLRAALNDIATPDERNGLTQSDGKISQDGINRVKRALFALAYGDDGLISRMSESTDDNVRAATNALLNAAPTIAKVRVAMQNGTLHKYDLQAIADAVKKLSALRDQGKPVSKYLQEQGLFAEHEDSQELKEILSFLDRNKRAPNKTAAFLKKIAEKIRNQGDPRQGNLFGEESKPAPLIDLIKSARQAVEGMSDLFAQEENQNGTAETSAPEESSRAEENPTQDAEPKQTQAQEVAAPKNETPTETQPESKRETPAREKVSAEESEAQQKNINALQEELKRKADDIRINNAAQNPDTARALKQLGATIKDGKVTFPDEETRQLAIAHLKNINDPNFRYAGEAGKIENYVDPKDLNSFQRALAEFAQRIGVPIIFFRGAKNFHGAHASGISFYNADAKFSHDFVYWHEFGHWLKNNQPKLFN